MSNAARPSAPGADDLAGANLEAELTAFRTAFGQIQTQLQQVIVGQEAILRNVLIAIFVGGHVLLEGVPGLGKTLLMSSLGDVLGLKVTRVQFTPDLMPADITGTRVMQGEGAGQLRFEFERGPIFTQIMLADEINRASPKTQSALLEAMQERKVSIAGTTYPLPEPFMVMATQNPLEQEGTYPLPEAQLDRFFFKLLVRFPTQLELIEVMKRTTGGTVSVARPVVQSSAQIVQWAKLLRRVPVANQILDYGAKILLATHPDQPQCPGDARKWLRCGASPRGLQAMILGAKARAVLAGRFAISREDLAEMAKPCLRHRILLSFEAEAEGIRADQLIDQIVQKTQ